MDPISSAKPDSSAASAAQPFVHLHLHSEYSLLDGACRLKQTVARAKQLGMPALALSDHGNMFGAIEFYSECVAAGIKPIVGCELYISPTSRFDKNSGPGKESAFHLLLLAQNLTGYRNLLKLTSIGYTQGFYYKPRIDHEVLREFSDGIIASSTCLGGQIPQKLLRENLAAARTMAETYLSIFGPDRFFIELQNHGLDDQAKTNPDLADIAKRLGLMTVATNDVHYLSADDVEAHDILCCISTRAKISEPNRFKFESSQFYLKSAAEMHAALPEYPDALANTLRIAEMCDVQFDFTKRFAPRYATPENVTAEDYLRKLVYEGAEKKYAKIDDELRERIEYELGVVSSKGFAGYFLIVWDFIQFARRSGIPVNTRGSGCSTVVGYCLGVSNVDPIRYGLYFERFMDPERDEMPDIDVDMCQDRREEVIQYVREKYGHVAQIITFGRLKPKAAIRDICRVLEVDLQRADAIAKLVPEELKMTIDKALEKEPELKKLYNSDPTIRKVIDVGRRLEGMARHASVHAAGVVIADVPLDTLIPLYKPADSNDLMTQFEGPTVEKVGLLKMDFLGLRTLSQIHKTCELVREHHGVEIDLDKLDLADQRVYQLLARGETRGIFQFESGGMRDVLMKMRPNRIEDLIAANALYRPGPMEYIDEYCARKHGKQWTTPHPIMTEVLAETYGIMVYQEQVSRLVNRLGDVPLRRAFRLAKAISKKKESMINAEREPFIAGCEKNGVSRKTAEEIFADILKFGGYAFNKAHSTGYGVVAFQTAYLKTYYPVEFMASLLTYESGSTEKIAEYLEECKRLRQPDGSVGIEVLPPDVNESDAFFTVSYPVGRGIDPTPSAQERGEGVKRGEGAAVAAGVSVEVAAVGSPADELNGPAPLANSPGNTGVPPARRGHIRFGLSAISGVGVKAVETIRAARSDRGRFRDLFDFCERIDLQSVNKAVIEALIKAGAFDCTGAMRRALMLALERAIEFGQTAQRDAKLGQLNMFGGGASAHAAKDLRKIGAEEWSDAEMLAYEKATLGFYITKHPLAAHESLVRAFATASTGQLPAIAKAHPPGGGYGNTGPHVRIAGLIANIRHVLIKQGPSAGKKMMIVLVEDFEGSVEAVAFPEKLDPIAQRWLKPDRVVFIEGTLDTRREDPSVRIQRVIPLHDAAGEFADSCVITLRSGVDGPEILDRFRSLARGNRGRAAVFFEVHTPDGAVATLRAREAGGLSLSPACANELVALFGVDRVKICGPRGPIELASLINAAKNAAASDALEEAEAAPAKSAAREKASKAAAGGKLSGSDGSQAEGAAGKPAAKAAAQTALLFG